MALWVGAGAHSVGGGRCVRADFCAHDADAMGGSAMKARRGDLAFSLYCWLVYAFLLAPIVSLTFNALTNVFLYISVRIQIAGLLSAKLSYLLSK